MRSKSKLFLPRIERDLLDQLWITRMTLLEGRRPRWIVETMPLPLLVLILPAITSGFSRQNLMPLGIGIGVYLVVSLSFLAAVYYLRARKNSRQPSMLLYATYDIWSVSCLAIVFITTGGLFLNDVLEKNHFALSVISKVVLGSFAALIVFSILFSKQMLVWKLKWIPHQDRFARYLPIALGILATAPGIGMIISKLLIRGDNISTGQFIFPFLWFSLASVLIFMTISGLYDIVVMATNKWPKIRRVNSEYIVVNDSD